MREGGRRYRHKAERLMENYHKIVALTKHFLHHQYNQYIDESIVLGSTVFSLTLLLHFTRRYSAGSACFCAPCFCANFI